MLEQQVADNVQRALRVRSAVNEVTDEYDPAFVVVRTGSQLIKYRHELIDLSMHVADHRYRAPNACCKLSHTEPSWPVKNAWQHRITLEKERND